jgi:hypothetical protein
MRRFSARTFIVSIFDDGTKACYPMDQEQRNQYQNARKALLSREILLDVIASSVNIRASPDSLSLIIFC